MAIRSRLLEFHQIKTRNCWITGDNYKRQETEWTLETDIISCPWTPDQNHSRHPQGRGQRTRRKHQRGRSRWHLNQLHLLMKTEMQLNALKKQYMSFELNKKQDDITHYTDVVQSFYTITYSMCQLCSCKQNASYLNVSYQSLFFTWPGQPGFIRIYSLTLHTLLFSHNPRPYRSLHKAQVALCFHVECKAIQWKKRYY